MSTASAYPPFFDDILYDEEYIRTCVGSTIFFILFHFTAYFVLANLPEYSLELNAAALERKQKRNKFLRESAQCAVGFFYHTFAAPVACYMLYSLWYDADSYADMIMVDPARDDSDAVRVVHSHLMTLSEIFIGYMLSLIFFFCLGWEEGLVNLMHHFTFLSICVISANFNFIVGAASLAMEMSSPALNLHYFYRNLAGERAERITGISVKFFALLFFIFRIIIYGWAVLLLCFILSTQVCLNSGRAVLFCIFDLFRRGLTWSERVCAHGDTAVIYAQELPIPINWYKMGISVALFLTGLALQVRAGFVCACFGSRCMTLVVLCHSSVEMAAGHLSQSDAQHQKGPRPRQRQEGKVIHGRRIMHKPIHKPTLTNPHPLHPLRTPLFFT